MYTIKDLCNKFNLSRSTILYYHSIGLLSQNERSNTNYRIYSDDSLQQLERICMYREAGVSLKDINKLLDLDKNTEREILEKTLSILNCEAKKVKKKQKLIVNLLEGNENIIEAINGINKDLIIESLKLVGIDKPTLDRIHANIEKSSPKTHKALLESFGFSNDEINFIREKARKATE